MDTRDQILAEIEALLRRTEMAETTFGRKAVNDGKFVARLRAGGGLTTRTADQVRAFIADQKAKLKAAESTEGAAA